MFSVRNISKKKNKGLLLPIFFQKVMMIGLVTGVMMWMIYSSINSEEVSVIMRQERNDVELWHQVLRSDIFRAESTDSAISTKIDYKMYFDAEKITAVVDSHEGDISCTASPPIGHCINFYPNIYYLNITVGTTTWLFTNDAAAQATDFDDYKYKEVIGIIDSANTNPTIGTIYFKTELYE